MKREKISVQILTILAVLTHQTCSLSILTKTQEAQNIVLFENDIKVLKASDLAEYEAYRNFVFHNLTITENNPTDPPRPYQKLTVANIDQYIFKGSEIKNYVQGHFHDILSFSIKICYEFSDEKIVHCESIEFVQNLYFVQDNTVSKFNFPEVYRENLIDIEKKFLWKLNFQKIMKLKNLRQMCSV